jgi:hypothetical protein
MVTRTRLNVTLYAHCLSYLDVVSFHGTYLYLGVNCAVRSDRMFMNYGLREAIDLSLKYTWSNTTIRLYILLVLAKAEPINYIIGVFD